MATPRNSIAFIDVMADLLRLPDETLAMTYLFINRYTRFQKSANSLDPLDAYTLALACLSLASKSTESPRRLREIIIPAHRLLHRYNDPSATGPIDEPLTVPSQTYDTLRATLVQAELMLLRVLGFQLRLPLPLDYLPQYLERVMDDVATAGEDYDNWAKEEQEEYGVLKSMMETGLGRACRAVAVDACKSYQLANLFPARAVALGSLYVVMKARGLEPVSDKQRWIQNISGRKVDAEDFEEVVEAIQSA